ncbi:hypothetical protein [Paenibacillus harenae]|uniref:hypothetical protein n=1 Tax=Paenibacillus harenae TaxID=306543 RepID=UPI000411D98A|nr:hypothetical protein [Paenibacillus harenae]
MGRLSKDLLDQIRKSPPTYWLGSRGITLFEHIDAIEIELKLTKEDEKEAVRKYGQAMKDIDRLTENVAQLQRENKRLMDEVDEAREPIKVVLPKEVVEAIEYYFSLNGVNKFDVLLRIERSADTIATVARAILHKKHGIDWEEVLMSALINGYTVEKSKEDRLRDGIAEIITAQYPFTADKDIAANVIDFVTKFNAENT